MKTRQISPLLFFLAIYGYSQLTVADEEGDASSDEVARLIIPDSSVRLGLRHIDGNARRFGQFTGATDAGFLPQLDLDLVTRDENSGTWLRFKGSNLVSDRRELRAEYEQQGAWKYALDYSRIPRHVPLEFSTGLTGEVSGSQQINGTALRNIDLETVRDVLKLAYQVRLPDAFEGQLRFKQERKAGARPSSMEGSISPSTSRVLMFITEPIDYVSKEMEASLAYTTNDLQLWGGYLGSWFGNHNKLNVINGVTVDGLTPAEISLPLDNAAHQIYLSGGYKLSPSARATFKLSFERATQDETFTAPSILATRQSLGGQVNSTLAHAGISAQVLEQLGVLANIRYEVRDDKTPIHQFLHALNTPYSRNTLVGKAETTYRFTREYSLTAGLDYDRRRRDVPSSIPFSDPASPAQSRQVSARTETDETGYRFEFRRSLTDDINGSLSYINSARKGSPYLPADNDPSPDVVAPIHWSDRDRSKWRLALDWVIFEPFSVQMVFEDADDRYSGFLLGPRQGMARLYSLDINYALSDYWQLSGWVSNNVTRTDQSSVSRSAIQWEAQLEEESRAFGFGLRGSPSKRIKVGADLYYARETNGFGISALAPGSAVLPTGLPPEIFYKTSNFVAFIEYALTANEMWRIDVLSQRVRTNDWTWDLVAAGGSSLYADGTVVNLPKDSRTDYVGVSYLYRWR